MLRPRVLDLYCGSGGPSVGYYLAGFDVIGVDLQRHPAYPFAFIQRDILSLLTDPEVTASVDLIHAGNPMPALLDLVGKPWVAANAEAGPRSITLCASHFARTTGGRHRRFQASFTLPDPGPCWCNHSPQAAMPRPVSMSDHTRWVGEQVSRRFFPGLAARDHHHRRFTPGRIERLTKL